VIVLDSSLLVAYHNERDVHHAAAGAVLEEVIAGTWGRALLLEYVFLEVVTVLLARRGLPTALAVGSLLMQAREIDFVPCSDFFLDTFETFRSQARGDLSFTDAAIVTAARRHPPGYVATFDSDFRGVDGVTVVPSP
jgi:predicted nucleic acid-binding protein